MNTYQIWCDIESGTLGIQLQIEKPPHQWALQLEDGGSATATVHLCHGKNALVILNCEHEVKRPDWLVRLVIQHLQALYDAALFMSGVSAQVIGRAALLSNGQMASLLLNDVRSLVDLSATGMTIEQLTQCSIESQIVRTSLVDLRNGCLNPQDAGMLCYRAIEGIMQTYKQTNEEESKEAWPRMRQSLKFEKSYIDVLSKHSVANRHGKPLSIAADEQRLLLCRALTILGRFARSSILGKSLVDDEFLK
jgi:hypothetical protein